MENMLNVFSSFSTDSLSESEYFYTKILGLETEMANGKFLHVYLNATQTLVIYEKQDHQPANFTILNIEVEDIKAEVLRLRDKGVSFINYLESFKTDDLGISWDEEGSHLAWLRDPRGNIIAFIQN